MLDSIEINSFLAVPYLKIDLSDSRVHMFCGDNEAGKSTVSEAVRFVLRGASPRVRLKGDLHQLIHAGKRTGHVEISMDGFPIRRNVRDAKVATMATLDYPDLLVDLQLGATEFAAADEKALRSMLNQVFKIGTPDAFIRQRLGEKGVTEDMMNETLPLIRVSGFAGAAEHADKERARSRAKWEAITNETYGSKKAVGWQPAVLSEPAVDEEQLAVDKMQLVDLNARRDALNRDIGAAAAALRLQQSASVEPIETLRERVQATTDAYTQAATELQESQDSFRRSAADVQNWITDLEHQLEKARAAATQLACPCCGAALTMTVVEHAPVLVAGEQAPQEGPSVAAITASLTSTRAVLADLQKEQRQTINKLQQAHASAHTAMGAAENELASRIEADNTPKITAEDIEQLAAELATLDSEIEQAKANIQDVIERLAARTRALGVKEDAAQAATRTAQWQIIAEALGNGPDGIPAELVAATTKPINSEMARLALSWERSPCVMGADMSLSRADGRPYYLLSTAARWCANAMMQLALATVSPLKLVILDGWDVIQPSDRGAFIGMLEDYTKRYPDISVLGMATLKARPAETVEGMKFHWIANGQLKEAA